MDPWTRWAPPELGAFTSNRLLTKPLIHPETGGQVSAGGARDEEKRAGTFISTAKLKKKKKNFPKLPLVNPTSPDETFTCLRLISEELNEGRAS